MDDIFDFSDDRLKAWCVHCGGTISSLTTNWDHAPSKSLLDKPLPGNVPQLQVCSKCNSSFSLDEEYFVSLMSCILTGKTDPASQVNPKVGRALDRNPKLRARLEAARITYTTQDDREQTVWKPEMNRIHRVILKNARGHAFYEFGEPMLDEPEYVRAIPLSVLNDSQRQAFETVESNLFPEVGSRMMTRVLTGQDLEFGWVIVQGNVYRYAVMQEGLMTIRSVIRNYLATEVRWSY